VAVITVICLSGCDFLCGRWFHDSDYYGAHGWPKLAAFWVAALVVRLLMLGPSEEYAGLSTTHEPKKQLFRDRDSLFFVPIRYWSIILFAVGIVFYFVRD